MGENPPSPNKKLRRWLSRKKKQKLDLQNIDNDSGSNRSDEPVSITEGVADSSLDDQSASKEDGDKQIWPLFKANSIFVFNSKKEDVKGLGPKMERKKSKSVAGTTKNRKKRVEISIIPSQIILLQLHGAVPATKPSLAMAAEHCSFRTEILNNSRICVYDRSDFIRLIVLTIST